MIKLASGEREISLFSTASRCLELLIIQQGVIIPQRELMAFAWKNHGLSVSPNTFYQNISSLRKSLAELIPDENIIVTIKRSGLIIPKDIEITRVSEELMPPLPDGPHSIDEPDITSKVTIKKSNVNAVHSLNDGNVLIQSQKYFWLSIWLFIILVSMAVLIKSHYFPSPQAENMEDPFRNYTFYKKINANCSLFVNPDAGQIDPENTLVNISQSGCKGYDRVYVTLYEGAITRSAMYCTVSNNTPTSCISEYFVRNKK